MIFPREKVPPEIWKWFFHAKKCCRRPGNDFFMRKSAAGDLEMIFPREKVPPEILKWQFD